MSDCEPTRSAPRSTQKTGAVVALIQSGVSDHAAIAKATGVTEQEVERIEAAIDQHVRDLAARETGRDVYYHLRCQVTCPRCGSVIYLVPCVACTVAKSAGKTNAPVPRHAAWHATTTANPLGNAPYSEEQRHHGS